MTFDIVVPLLGFKQIKKVHLQKIDDIFMKMESVTNKDLSFTLVNPFALREYAFEVPDKTKELLKIDENSNILILNIMLIQVPIEDSMVNFIAPVVFNTDTNRAAQVIISNSKTYGVAEKVSSFILQKSSFNV